MTADDPVKPKDGMTFSIVTPLDEDGTVGIVEDIEPGGETIIQKDAKAKFRRAHPSNWERDPPENLLVSCDGGDVTVQGYPEFAPVETCIKTEYYRTALDELRGEDTYVRPQFDLLFDNAGPVVFRGEKVAVGVAPIQFTWDRPAPKCAPCGPRGPSI